jgi:uncharacterized protein (TIGR02246 family)
MAMNSMAERVRRLNAAVNTHDLNPIGDMYAEDGEFTWPGFPTLKGRQAVVGFYAQIFGAFPDVQVTIKRVLEQGDSVAVEYETVATHTGPIPMTAGELPPTNKRFVQHAVSIATADSSGRIRTQREYFDQVEILTQLGVMPSAAGASA